MKVLSVLFLALLAGDVAAADWYWRPYQGSVAGDGRSYRTAWRSEASIAWARMQPGDRLLVCGTHDSGVPGDQRLVIGADNITVSGACPGDPGRLLSAGAKLKASAWQGSGVLSQDYGGSSSEYVLTEALERVPVVAEAAIAESACPAFAFNRTVSKAFYKPCGTPETIYANFDRGIIIKGRRNVTVGNLPVLNASTGIEIVDSEGIDLQPDVRFASSSAIWLVGTTRNGRIHDGDIRDSANGIYGITGKSGGSHDGWIIENNDIYRIWGGHLDAHGIGWQHGSDNVFRNNDIREVAGTGITLYVFATGTLNRNLIKGNRITDVGYRSLPGHNRRGIEIGGDMCPGEAVGNRVEDNYLTNVPELALYLKVRDRAPDPLSLSVTGNVLTNTGAIGIRNIGRDRRPRYAVIAGNTGATVQLLDNVPSCRY